MSYFTLCMHLSAQNTDVLYFTNKKKKIKVLIKHPHIYCSLNRVVMCVCVYISIYLSIRLTVRQALIAVQHRSDNSESISIV